jgi:hypothetical protein
MRVAGFPIWPEGKHELADDIGIHVGERSSQAQMAAARGQKIVIPCSAYWRGKPWISVK